MDFNTTFQVNAGNISLGHPSMFQTPATDVLLDEDIEKAKTIDPAHIWQRKISKQPVPSSYNMSPQYRVPFDPKDPPLTRAERESFIAKTNAVIDKTLNNTQPSMLFYLFFSPSNLSAVQKNLRFAVNKWSGHHIGDQSTLELTLLMENIFMSHARHIDENNAPSKMVFKHLYSEIGRLNELVVNTATPIIIDGLEQHIGYMKSVDNPVTAESLQRPVDTKITGTMMMRSPTDIF